MADTTSEEVVNGEDLPRIGVAMEDPRLWPMAQEWALPSP